MSELTLKIGFSENPRILPLIDGNIRIEGAALEWEHDYPGALFLRQLKEQCYDVFEFSISDYFIVSQRPEWSHLGWTAIPIFLSKPLSLLFSFHAHARANIHGFADLAGKRVGVPDYGMTAAVWLRIMLRSLYGIKPQDITWFNGRPPSQRHGRLLGVDSTPANGIKLINLDEGASLNDMLQRGEIDAAMGSGFGAPVTESATVRRFSTPEVVRGFLADFYRKDGVTPVNHTLMMKAALLQQDPRLAVKLFDAFEASKQEAYRRARAAAEGYLLFPDDDFRRQAGEFGKDPYPSGLAENRRMLGIIAEQQVLDGLITRAPASIGQLYVEATRGT